MLRRLAIKHGAWRRGRFKDVLQKICQDFHLSFVVLFGSRAFREKGFKEDYDLAVFCQRHFNFEEEIELAGKFSQILQNDALDLVILNRASPLLQYEVATSGQLLFEQDIGSFNTFCWRALQVWNDNKKFYQQNLAYVKSFLKERQNNV